MPAGKLENHQKNKIRGGQVAAASGAVWPDGPASGRSPNEQPPRPRKTDSHLERVLLFPLLSVALVFIAVSFLPVNWCHVPADRQALAEFLKDWWPAGARIAAGMKRHLNDSIGCLYELYLPFLLAAMIVSIILSVRYMLTTERNAFILYMTCRQNKNETPII